MNKSTVEFLLLPAPKKIVRRDGKFKFATVGTILVDRASGTEDLFSARQLRESFPGSFKHFWKIVRIAKDDSRPMITLRRNGEVEHEQGYRITIAPDGATVEARTAAGMFYGVQTLIQIARQHGKTWPAATIEDWPDFSRRGVYHDVSRGKVPKLATILQLVNDLAALKINEFQLYVENIYAFKRHPEMYDDTTPLTARELRTIDAACRERFIDFVPSLTSLGHFDKILSRPTFRHLAEAEPAELRKAGIQTWSDQPWTLCVTDPAAKRLLKDMYEEYLPNFTSKQFNICCDESWDLGKGRSKALADKIGVGKMYVDWVKYCHGLAAKQGRKIQMWGDIILHHPELIGQLSKDVTLLEWGYEADHEFAQHAAKFAKAGRAFYVAPGTSTWMTFAGRTANAFANMRNAAEAGLKHGAAGFLNTDWGDHGHQQFLTVSLLPFAFGAAVSWNQADTIDDEVIAAAAVHVFKERGSGFAAALADLGQTYQRIGVERKNASVDWFLFRESWKDETWLKQVKRADLLKTINATEEILKKLRSAKLQRRDGRIIREEAMLTARTIIYTAKRTLIRKALSRKPSKSDRKMLRALIAESVTLMETFYWLWLSRNKPSRLLDVQYFFARDQGEFAAILEG